VVRDRGVAVGRGVALGRKILVYPMLDDRNVIPDPARAAPSTASTKPRSRSVVFSPGSL
jgi:hypothetical protein